jgi:preprotein translocase subunit YajC
MFLTVLAQSSNNSGSGLVALLPFVLIAVAMYFLLIRPQRRRMQEQRSLANAVEEGDEVLTTAGMYGFVTAIEGDVIWLEIAEGIDIRVARQAVSRRIPVADAGAGTSTESTSQDSTNGADDSPDDSRDSGSVKGERDAPSAD